MPDDLLQKASFKCMAHLFEENTDRALGINRLTNLFDERVAASIALKANECVTTRANTARSTSTADEILDQIKGNAAKIYDALAGLPEVFASPKFLSLYGGEIIGNGVEIRALVKEAAALTGLQIACVYKDRIEIHEVKQ